MTQPIDALQMAHDAGFEIYKDRKGDNHAFVEGVKVTPDVNALICLALERAAIECEQSEAYRGSVFAQRIRALKPSQDQATTLDAEDKQ